MKERMLLLNFYVAYETWVSSGAKEGYIFRRHVGLCDCLSDWCFVLGLSRSQRDALLEIMHADFVAAGLDKLRPFNLSSNPYSEEQLYNSCHENKARLEWVRKQIAEFENVVGERDALKAKGHEVLREASYVYEKYNQMVDHLDGEFVDGQTLHEFDLLLQGKAADTSEEQIHGSKPCA